METAAEVGHQRQGDALDRLRGRRLRAARVRGRLRFRRGARRRARQGRQAKRDLPPTPTSRACTRSTSLFPVMVVALSGAMPERTLCRSRATAKNAIEQVPGVLSAELRGTRDEVVEIIAEPMLLKSYGVSLDQFASRRRRATACRGRRAGRRAGPLRRQGAGADRDAGGRAEHPVAASSAAHGHARRRRHHPADLQGRDLGHPRQRPPAVTIEVSKRTGANLIETVDGVKQRSSAAGDLAGIGRRHLHPGQVESSSADAGRPAEQRHRPASCWSPSSSCSRSASAPRSSSASRSRSSFLTGVLGLEMLRATINIVVLFSLILAVGMLVDDAIIVSEFAERRMTEGMKPKEAYAFAAARMSGPVIAATATRVAAFSPLLFWPGIVGEFMKYLPITLIATLSASLVVALIFTPTLGALIGKARSSSTTPRRARPLHEDGALAIRHPWITLLARVRAAGRRADGLRQFGKGVEFFPDVEPDTASSSCMRAATSRWPRRTGWCAGRGAGARHRRAVDGLRPRRRAAARLGAKSPRTRSADPVRVRRLAGARARRARSWTRSARDRRHSRHPGRGDRAAAVRRPASRSRCSSAALSGGAAGGGAKVAGMLAAAPEIRDLDDGLPLPGIDWRLEIDKAEAAKYGIGVGSVGSVVQLVTNGMKITDYRPRHRQAGRHHRARARGPAHASTRSTTCGSRRGGPVPIGNFVKRVPAQRVGLHQPRRRQARHDGDRQRRRGRADRARSRRRSRRSWEAADFGGLVTWKLKGEDEEREKAAPS
jgi:multidrug efflux pump